MGVYLCDISIMNEMDPSLDEFRNVFIQFGHFIRYRKWPLIEMYISNQHLSFRNGKSTKANSTAAQFVRAHTDSTWNLLYMHLFRLFFATPIF